MKKKIIISLVILLALSLVGVAAFVFVSQNKSSSYIKMDTNVEDWLKITKVCEYDGKLAIVVQNTSEMDIEYASLTAKNKNESLSFEISVLLSGTETMLLCNENAKFDSKAIYTAWKTQNVVHFEKAPVMNDEKIEVSLTNGSISIRNVSDKDITSDILIYYKEKIDGILNGSVTHRVITSGLKSGAQTYIKINGINPDTYQIMFIEYDK